MKAILIILFFVVYVSALGQDKKEVSSYFEYIKPIVANEQTGKNLVYRLDTLKSKFIPSRSLINDYFNRDIDCGFKHRRILLRINFVNFQIDLLCKADTIFLSSIKTEYYKNINYQNFNKDTIQKFVSARNKLYNSSKTIQNLLNEISLDEEYAFYCGFANSLTQKGKYVDDLVDNVNINGLNELLQSFNCENQAFGVAGFDMLIKKDYRLNSNIQFLINHIKKRNSELITCSGCLGGLIDKIYSKKNAYR